MRIAQTVGVIDSQPGDQPFCEQMADQSMDGVEHARFLDANRRELVDIEKPAVVDFIGRDPPVGQPVPLLIQQLFELIETACVPFLAVDLPDRAIQRVFHGRRRLDQIGQTATSDLLFSIPFFHRERIATIAWRQITELRDDALQLDPVGAALARRLHLRRTQVVGRFKNVRPGRRRQRISPRAIAQLQSLVVVNDLQVAVLQHAAERFAQKWQQYLAVQGGCRGMPVDVEKAGEVRALAVLQHVEPPGVAGVVDPHVVGNHVEQDPHAGFSGGLGHALKLPQIADGRVDCAMVDHVVPVAAFLARGTAARDTSR